MLQFVEVPPAKAEGGIALHSRGSADVQPGAGPAQGSPPDAVIRSVFIGDAVTNAGYAVLVADENMRYLAATDGACELLGYSREELVGMAVSDLVVETNAPNLYEQFVRDRAQRGAITLRRKDGSHVSATYDARETLVRHMPYYVSWLTPLNG